MTTAASAEQHYDADYFAWQRRIGEFSAKANRFKFAPHIAPTDRVIDFGCGGGYLLAALTCAERMGVEANPIARIEAERLTSTSPDGMRSRPYRICENGHVGFGIRFDSRGWCDCCNNFHQNILPNWRESSDPGRSASDLDDNGKP